MDEDSGMFDGEGLASSGIIQAWMRRVPVWRVRCAACPACEPLALGTFPPPPRVWFQAQGAVQLVQDDDEARLGWPATWANKANSRSEVAWDDAVDESTMRQSVCVSPVRQLGTRRELVPPRPRRQQHRIGCDGRNPKSNLPPRLRLSRFASSSGWLPRILVCVSWAGERAGWAGRKRCDTSVRPST